jgi:hypothetical protein
MSETPIALEVNCETGEVTERPFTADEIASAAERAEQYAAEQAAREEAEAAAAAAKDSATKKLAKLGLSADEIAALLP